MERMSPCPGACTKTQNNKTKRAKRNDRNDRNERNDQNETTETSETTKTKRPKQPKRAKRPKRKHRNNQNETTETKPPKRAEPPKRPKRPKRNRQNQRNHRNEQRGIRSPQIADSTDRAGLSIIYFFFGEIFISRNTKKDRVLLLVLSLGRLSGHLQTRAQRSKNLNYRNQNFILKAEQMIPMNCFARFGCFGRFVLVVSFCSFRFVVLGFSTCLPRLF